MILASIPPMNTRTVLVVTGTTPGGGPGPLVRAGALTPQKSCPYDKDNSLPDVPE